MADRHRRVVGIPMFCQQMRGGVCPATISEHHNGGIRRMASFCEKIVKADLFDDHT